MNAYAIFAVNEHLEYLIEDAARNRSQKTGPSLRQRIANATASVRLNFATAKYESSSILPKLEDYPYRG